MIEWVDSTSYSRNRERIQTGWTAKLDKGFQITVTCGHIYYPGRFVMHCDALGIDTVPLPEGFTPEQAQQRAIEIARVKLDRMRAALPGREEHTGE